MPKQTLSPLKHKIDDILPDLKSGVSSKRMTYKNLLIYPVLFLIIPLFLGVYLVQKPKNTEIDKASFAGDCEGSDGDVDILDFQALSNTFAKSPGDPGYNAACNFNSDPMIEILDYQLLSNNFGLVAPTASVTSSVTQTPQPTPPSGPLPAFPGAEGFGSRTGGGRGGRVIEVTNTNEAGPGSLREAIDATGPRIIVFKTGGYITLHREMVIKEPFVTIAGQTAPGDGIVIRGGPIYVGTHDVIIRGLRVRPGDALDGARSTIRDGIAVSSSYTNQEVFNVIIDHSSISWGVDETASSWTNKVHDFTFSWNIISESLNDSIHIDEGATGYDLHSMGFLIGDYSEKVSAHHNLLAHNRWRNAFIRQGSVEFINNVIYNWGQESTSILDSNGTAVPQNSVNIVGNYYKSGPNTSSSRMAGVMVQSAQAGSKIYLKGNIGPTRPTDSGDEWTIATCTSNCYKSTSPAFTPSGVNVQSAADAYNSVIQKAGALSPRRDAVDTYVVSTVTNGTGKIIDCIQTCDEASDIRNYHNGWPQYASGSAPTDSDHDGMPDAWEQQRGGNLNPNNSAPSGYNWIEEYVNSLIR